MLSHEPSTFNKYFPKGDEFIINYYEEKTLEDCVFHSHEFLELCYVHAGCGYHIVGDKKYAVMKGDLFIINHEIPHVFYREKEHRLMTYNMMFKPGFFDGMLLNFNDFSSLTLSYLFRNICDENYARQDLRLNAEEQLEFEPVIENIFREYSARQDGYINSIRAYMILLIIKMMRSVKSRASNYKSPGNGSTMMNSVITYLQENYASHINLNELVLKSFYSKNYLCTLFKETTGTTISQYIQNLRIKEACRLLETSKEKIIDIATMVGFSDYKSFASCFKKIMGVMPKEYKKKVLGKN